MESNGVNPMKRSLDLYGTKTSISVEDVFWTTLDQIARERKTTRCNLIASIEEKRQMGRNLSSAVRVYVLSYVLAREAARAARCRCQTGVESRQGAERSNPMTKFAITHNIERYQYFVVHANIVRLTKLLRTTVDEGNRRTLLSLLAEEQAKLRALTPEKTADETTASCRA